MDNETVGKRIKKWRKLKKITQSELGAKINKTLSSVQKYEKGNVTIPIDVLNNIAIALNIGIDNLLFGVSDSNKNIKEEVLKTFDIEELLKRQTMLDKKFDEKETIRKRELRLIRLAYHTELGEFLQEVKSEWNYWKNSCKAINKQRALEELSDMLHFSLSYVNNDHFDSRIGNNDIRFRKKILEDQKYGFTELIDFLTSLYNNAEHFANILLIVEQLGATEEEFLQVHHEVWLRNTEERTKGEY